MHIEKRSENSNASLIFLQSSQQIDYIMHLYELFKDLCPSAPKISSLKPDKRTGNVYSSIRFQTYSLPCFNEFHDLLYVNGLKVIPNNIFEHLTPQALAIFAWDDGTKQRSGFIFCTDNLSKAGNLLIINVLEKKFQLECSLRQIKSRKGKVQYRFYIQKESMPKFKELVLPYFNESMMYKLK